MEKGDIILDKDGAECTITDKTTSSYRIAIKKKKAMGVNSNDWYPDRDVKDRFKLK